jgi:hypothetical protein
LRVVDILSIKVVPLVAIRVGLDNTKNQLFTLASEFCLLRVV